MIAVIDYDAGNIRSVEKALLALGQEVHITGEPQEILRADKVILPGVEHLAMPWKILEVEGLNRSSVRSLTGVPPSLGFVWGFSFSLTAARKRPARKGWVY